MQYKNYKIWTCPFCPYFAFYSNEDEYIKAYREHLSRAHPEQWQKLRKKLIFMV
jgi:uncharacterized protein (DUF2225 family)